MTDHRTGLGVNPFEAPGEWLRGNLHTHSTRSDGQKAPEDVVAWYAAQGYDFMALTDHRRVPEPEDLVAPAGKPFVVLPGTEVDLVDGRTGVGYHLICLGLQEKVTPPQGATVQEALAQASAAASVVYVAHPYWHAHETADLLDLTECAGIEVYNATCEYLNGKGYSVVHWDALLRRGRLMWGFAADDAHWNRPDAGRAWVMVKATDRSPEAILEALARGRFYSSTGPRLEHVEVQEGQIVVRCSPVDRVAAIGPAERGRVVAAAEGETLTTASIRISVKEQYLRLEAVDAQSRRAWTNPLVFRPASEQTV